MGRVQEGPHSQLGGTAIRCFARSVNEEQMWEAGLAPTSELGAQLDFLTLIPPGSTLQPTDLRIHGPTPIPEQPALPCRSGTAVTVPSSDDSGKFPLLPWPHLLLSHA